MIAGDEWDGSIVAGLLHSLCVIPLMSYGSTAPLAHKLHNCSADSETYWETAPMGLQRLKGEESDRQDSVLKVVNTQLEDCYLTLFIYRL